MVLDPFCGTGTTGIAALTLGRRFTGIDLNPVFAELAAQRLRQAAAQPPGTALPTAPATTAATATAPATLTAAIERHAAAAMPCRAAKALLSPSQTTPGGVRSQAQHKRTRRADPGPAAG